MIVLSHTGDDFDNPELAATNTLGVDDDHTVYAEVRDEHGNLVSDGVEIVFEVRDPGDSTVIFETSVDATTEDGVASFIYDAPDNPRNDEIVASWDAGAVTEEDALTKSWEAAVVVTSVTIEASPNPVQGWPTQNTSFSIEAEGTDLEGEEIEVCRDPANAPGTFTIAGTGSGTQADSCYTVTLDSAGEMVEDLGYDTVFAAGPNSATIEFTATHEASGEDDSVVVEFVGTGFQI